MLASSHLTSPVAVTWQEAASGKRVRLPPGLKVQSLWWWRHGEGGGLQLWQQRPEAACSCLRGPGSRGRRGDEDRL